MSDDPLVAALTTRLVRLAERTDLPEDAARELVVAALEAIRLEASLRAWAIPSPN